MTPNLTAGNTWLYKDCQFPVNKSILFLSDSWRSICGESQRDIAEMLQAWKWKTSTELIIDPEMDTSEKCNLDIPDSTNEQVDLNEKSDVISALS